jgi:NPCBM/NEW2 domain
VATALFNEQYLIRVALPSRQGGWVAKRQDSAPSATKFFETAARAHVAERRTLCHVVPNGVESCRCATRPDHPYSRRCPRTRPGYPKHAEQAPPVAWVPLLAMLIAFLAAPLLAADPASRLVTLVDSEGKTHTGPLSSLSAGQLALGPTEPHKFRTRSLVSLKFKDRLSNIGPGDPLVILGRSEIILLQPETIDDESLTGSWTRFPDWPALKIPLETVRGIIVARPAGSAAGSRLINQVFDYSAARDAVLLGNGDTLEGEFAGLTRKELTLELPFGKSAIDRAGVRAILFNAALAGATPLRGEGALLSLVDGSRLVVKDVSLSEHDRLSARAQFGTQLEVPLAAVESLRFLGGCADYLSDLAPAEFKFEPYFELDWPLVRDRSVAGGFLSLRGVEYPKGLGMHSRSTVTWRLDGKYRRFRATLGIDDATEGKGSALFEVLLDGKPAWRSDVLTGTSPALALERIDLTGVKLLTLRVDYATDADVCDHANWCDAVLVK